MKMVLTVLTGCLIFIACAKENEVDLSAQSVCDTANMKYAADLVPVLRANCYSCHETPGTEGGGIVLSNYTNLKLYAQSGTLLNVIRHAPGFSAMPKGGAKLSDCSINKIKSWIDNGMKND